MDTGTDTDPETVTAGHGHIDVDFFISFGIIFGVIYFTQKIAREIQESWSQGPAIFGYLFANVAKLAKVIVPLSN